MIICVLNINPNTNQNGKRKLQTHRFNRKNHQSILKSLQHTRLWISRKSLRKCNEY